MGKSKAHTIYKLKDGTKIPGVTTITGLRAKPQLIPWANKLGLQGIDSSKYVDDLAEVGTVAHYLVLCHLTSAKPDLSDYSPNVVSRAENSFIKYLEWEKAHDVKPILVEHPFVSEEGRFGGTVDFYGTIDGVFTLLDLKTSKAIWPEMFYQLAGYLRLLHDNGRTVQNVRILRIGRSEDEGFEEKVKNDLLMETVVFNALLAVYEAEKLIKKGE